jgi:formylglycine-generating enzyme required for sulfatase activity
VIVVEAPGKVTTRLPVLLAAGETVKLAIAPSASLPPDMVYVPPGRFLFGSGDSTQLRRAFLNAPPLHEVTTSGYLIGRHEVTLGDWIAFLDDLPPEERARRTPRSHTPYAESSLELVELAPKRWRFQFTHANRTYAADMTEHVHYEHRTARADQDWLRFPVAAIAFDDAVAYARWLDRTNRLPGARLCDEYEWERAARGADGRPYPAGDALGPDDANIDVTYGRDPLAFGPDEVGSHPGSRSVLGVDDMAGNVWEWTRSVERVDAPVTRGGGWYQAALDASSTNREAGEPTERYVWLGFRLCADAPGR